MISSDSHKSTKEQRELLAARRLAALGVKGGDGDDRTSQYIAGASAPPLPSNNEKSIDRNMRTLLDMGFPRDDARAALLAANNSLEEAITTLS